jgi:hypothetical protein
VAGEEGLTCCLGERSGGRGLASGDSDELGGMSCMRRQARWDLAGLEIVVVLAPCVKQHQEDWTTKLVNGKTLMEKGKKEGRMFFVWYPMPLMYLPLYLPLHTLHRKLHSALDSEIRWCCVDVLRRLTWVCFLPQCR